MNSALRLAAGRTLLLCWIALSIPCASLAQQATPPPEARWPHTVTVGDASAVVYQPQVVSWPGHTTLNARAAVSISMAGSTAPVLGTIEVTMATQTDFATRSVILSDPRLTATHFPSLDTSRAAQVEAGIKASLGDLAFKRVPLDTMLISLRENAVAPEVAEVRNDPPVIFYSARPASLVVFDGDPVLAPVPGISLSFAVNTNWDVFFDPAGRGTWYLLDNGSWFAAPAASGPFIPVATLPQSLPDDPNFAEARKAIPGRMLAPEATPTIFVSTSPAELIVTTGPPVFRPIAGTSVQYATNTDSALFRHTTTGRFYYLVSGRWFSAASLDGPWTFATPDLPADFARIPQTSPVSSVLPAVPGTAQAQEAVLQAQIPQQATLDRSAAKLDVTYVGSPQFRPIPGTDISYAVNTAFEVIEAGHKYYACYQGAWFVAPAPTGPWTLADTVPPTIYGIPASNPLHNVTYVKVYSATPAAVTFGYTGGYTAAMISAGVLVYGTGYHYPPVVMPGPVPVYLPYPYTYAGGVYYNPANGVWGRGGTIYGPYATATGRSAYNPATGAYARGGAVYGPYGGASAFSAYNPSTGGYARGSAVWGPDGGTAYGSYYNPRTGVSGSTTQNANAYGRWGSSTFSGPDQTIHTESGSNSRGSAGAFRSSTGAEGAGFRGPNNSGGVVRGAGGNVYAGHDGNAYRHTDSGWSQWSNGSWQPVQPPTRSGTGTTGGQQNTLGASQPSAASPAGQRNAAGTSQGSSRADRQGQQSTSWSQLEQDRQARQVGEQRQRQFNNGFSGALAGGAGGRGFREGGWDGAGRGGGGFHRR